MINNSIVCFGEILWDIFPSHKVVGGAPMNVAFHLNNFGRHAQLVSAVGDDQLGKELISFLSKKGIPTNFIHTNDTFPTGTVQVNLDEKGAANYEITAPVAWDFLPMGTLIADAVLAADLFIFGSLVCRSKHNLKTLLQLIEKAQTPVFDVNLRPPFYEQSVVEQLLQKAVIVKMNDEELAIIAKWYQQKGSLNDQMNFLMNHFDIKTLLMTAGKNGAYCMQDKKLYVQKGFPVQVQDTIGSGDSFFAAFLYKMLSGMPIPFCLAFACATGALVATKVGGTPAINENSVTIFMQKYK